MKSKQPIRSRYLGHVTGYQPIRDQYFMVRSVPARENNKLTFYSSGCPTCTNKLLPLFLRLSHIHSDVIFYEVDVDDNEQIAEARRVGCMPTFQFFKKCK